MKTGTLLKLFNLYLTLFTLLFALPQFASAHERHPLAMHELDWQAENIKSVYAMAGDFHAGALIKIWNMPGRVQVVEDRRCLVGPYFIFDVDDDFAFNIDETVTVELLFAAAQTDGFIISYDHASDSPQARTVMLDWEGGERRQWVSVELERAGFANRRHGHTDLGIAAPGALLEYDAQADHEIVLCDMKIVREGRQEAGQPPAGTLSLHVRDGAGGDAVPARVGLYDAKDRMPAPGEQALVAPRFTDSTRQVPVRREFEFWPAGKGYAFYVDGGYEAQVPAGRYQLVVGRGPEYRIHTQDVEIRARGHTRVEVELQRWIDMPERGWYSGDVHIHIERTRGANPGILSLLSAEDIHVANLLQMGNLARYYFPQYAFGEDGHYLRDNHALVSGQESPRTGQRGHTISLNISRYHDPVDFFLYHDTAMAVQANGGLFGYAHAIIDAFHVSRGLALDVPMGLVDFLEVLQFSMIDTEFLYDFWNLGFRLAPVAGSDFPYINLPGTERSYVRIDGPFSPQAWFDGLRQGRTFATNGPMLSLDVAGGTIGDTVAVAKGETLNITARARVNPDLDSLARVELVIHGDVAATTVSGEGSESLVLDHTLTADRSCWIALRAYGKNGGLSHSAPVYVSVDGVQEFWNTAAVPALVEKYRNRIKTLLNTLPDAHDDLERWDTADLLEPVWKAQLPALRQHADKVLERYDEMLQRLE